MRGHAPSGGAGALSPVGEGSPVETPSS
jgi:hypothetical protein